MNTSDLRKSAQAIFIAVDECVAQDISDKLNYAANKLDAQNKAIEILESVLEQIMENMNFIGFLSVDDLEANDSIDGDEAFMTHTGSRIKEALSILKG